ncbi:MAG: M42 family peptidase [Oscillospiraceae bacterium]|nr:M42 family peptidase [Oscillospiraceae bacterium]
MNRSRLEQLCTLCGTSGREHLVREYLLQQIHEAGISAEDIRTDRLGNLTVHKKGRNPAKAKVLFSAHMDEVALMVTAVNDDGTLSFDCVGGVNAAAVIGRTVKAGAAALNGVIGTKPVHHLSGKERKEPAEMSALYCDIGTSSAAETAECGISAGDILYFDTVPQTIGDSFAAKAIDDRFGCEILLTLLSRDLPYDIEVAFVVQEEVGLRGAGVAARAVDPDIAVVLEATTAADLPDSHGADRVCCLGGGAVISLIDGRTVYDKALYDLAAQLCDSRGIRWQTKSKIAGGNDAGAIQNAGSGVRVAAVSVPCRYLHAPVSVIRYADAEACEALAIALAETLPEGTL